MTLGENDLGTPETSVRCEHDLQLGWSLLGRCWDSFPICPLVLRTNLWPFAAEELA